jgi:hypothetical protein
VEIRPYTHLDRGILEVPRPPEIGAGGEGAPEQAGVLGPEQVRNDFVAMDVQRVGVVILPEGLFVQSEGVEGVCQT